MVARGNVGAAGHCTFLDSVWDRSGPFCSIKKVSVADLKHSGVKWDKRSWSDCSWVKPVIIPPVLASFTSAPQMHHWRAAASQVQQKKNSSGAEDRRDSKEQRKENTRSETPVPSFRKKWKCVLLPGRVPLFWCFYSNNFHVPVFPACRVGIMQHAKKQ